MKKALSVVGLIIGLSFVVVGILAVSGDLGRNTSFPSRAPYGYDSGYASFGGDYYTYSVNNSAEAASAARTAADNIGDVYNLLLTLFGLTSILFGLMVMCGFGIVLSSCTKKREKNIIDSESNIVKENTDITNNASI